MKPICTIRRLRTDDRAEWGRLWTSYLDYYQTSVVDAVYDSTFFSACWAKIRRISTP